MTASGGWVLAGALPSTERIAKMAIGIVHHPTAPAMEPVNPYAPPLAPGGESPSAAAEQPLSLSGALNVGTSLYLRRIPTWAALTLVLWTPAELVVSYLEYFAFDPDDLRGPYFLTMLADALVGIVAVGGTISVGEAELCGERRSWLAGLRDGLAAWPRIFSSRFIGGLVLVVAAMACLLPAFYFGVRYSLSDCTALLERRAGMNALSRSMDLARGRFLVLLGLCAITVVPIGTAGFVIYLPLEFYPPINHWLVSAALSCVLDLLVPWMTLVFVSAYVQRRAEERRENLPIPAALAAPDQT